MPSAARKISVTARPRERPRRSMKRTAGSSPIASTAAISTRITMLITDHSAIRTAETAAIVSSDPGPVRHRGPPGPPLASRSTGRRGRRLRGGGADSVTLRVSPDADVPMPTPGTLRAVVEAPDVVIVGGGVMGTAAARALSLARPRGGPAGAVHVRSRQGQLGRADPELPAHLPRPRLRPDGREALGAMAAPRIGGGRRAPPGRGRARRRRGDRLRRPPRSRRPASPSSDPRPPRWPSGGRRSASTRARRSSTSPRARSCARTRRSRAQARLAARRGRGAARGDGRRGPPARRGTASRSSRPRRGRSGRRSAIVAAGAWAAPLLGARWDPPVPATDAGAVDLLRCGRGGIVDPDRHRLGRRAGAASVPGPEPVPGRGDQGRRAPVRAGDRPGRAVVRARRRPGGDGPSTWVGERLASRSPAPSDRDVPLHEDTRTRIS